MKPRRTRKRSANRANCAEISSVAVDFVAPLADLDKPATRMESSESVGSMIVAGGGAGVIPCVQGDAMPTVARVFRHPVSVIQTWFVYHETSRNSARIKAVVELLAEFAEARSELLRGSNGGRLKGYAPRRGLNSP